MSSLTFESDVIDLSKIVPRRSDRVIALAITAVVVIMSLAAGFWSRMPLSHSLPLFALIIATSMSALAMTAILLWAQSAFTQSRSIAVLALGYGLTAGIVAPYILLYHGLWPELGRVISADAQTPYWLWVEWHLSFISSIIAFQICSRTKRPLGDRADARTRSTMAWGSLGLYVIVVAPAIWINGLPAFSDGNDQWAALSYVNTIVLGSLALVATGLSLRISTKPSAMDTWLLVTSIAIFVEVILSKVSGAPFTVGWYASRLDILVAALAVLIQLLFQTRQVYGELAAIAKRLREETITDALTKITNRRGFEDRFYESMRQARRSATPLTLMMVDIDSFKVFNDAFGHIAGDECLRVCAQTLRDGLLRPNDLVARFGGEEFVLMLPDTPHSAGLIVAERLRAAVERLALPQGGNLRRSFVTISIGLTTSIPGTEPIQIEQMLFEADRALYKAKAAGRNCVRSADELGSIADLPSSLLNDKEV